MVSCVKMCTFSQSVSRAEGGVAIIGMPVQLETVLDRLPVSVELFSAEGHVLGKAGGIASMFGDVIPALDAKEAARWSFVDRQGVAIPRTHWASVCALRGERNYAGLIGSFRNGEEHRIRVTCMPVGNMIGEVAGVAFLQLLDARSRAVAGSESELQHRLIDHLVQAVSSSEAIQMHRITSSPSPASGV